MNSSDEAPERLFVGNIPSWFRDSDLRSLFGKYGPITDAHIVLSEQGTAVRYLYPFDKGIFGLKVKRRCYRVAE